MCHKLKICFFKPEVKPVQDLNGLCCVFHLHVFNKTVSKAVARTEIPHNPYVLQWTDLAENRRQVFFSGELRYIVHDEFSFIDVLAVAGPIVLAILLRLRLLNVVVL